MFEREVKIKNTARARQKIGAKKRRAEELERRRENGNI